MRPSRSRVRVIPGSPSSFPTPPPPPPESPPKPSHLCKIAVVGDAYCGKSALAQRFIHRRYANRLEDTDEGGAHCYDGDGANHANGAASAASNSVGTPSLGASIGASCEEGLEPTLAEYHKKDIAIWEQQGGKNDMLEHVERAVCVRVQLWDMNIAKQQQPEPDSEAPSSRLISLLKRTQGIMIVCRCPVPPSSFSESSEASYESHTSNVSCSEWPELDSLEQQIRRWKTFLRDEVGHENQQSSTTVLLSCADLVIEEYSPRGWARLSDRIHDICYKCGIDSWKIGTCMDTTASSDHTIDGNFSPQCTMLQKMMHQQRQILEDMEDAVEASFMELISSCLRRSRKKHN